MARVTISIPDQMSAFVDTQIDTGRYGNVSEYFRDLVRRDQDRKQAAIQELQSLIQKAEASGLSDRSLPEILEAAKDEARRKGLLE